MFRVGLTGGIGSGKSTVATFFRSKNILVIDLDQIARKVVAPSSLGLEKIVEHFGKGIIQSDGALDRPKLSTLIFNQPSEKKWLEWLLRCHC